MFRARINIGEAFQLSGRTLEKKLQIEIMEKRIVNIPCPYNQEVQRDYGQELGENLYQRDHRERLGCKL